MPQILLVGSGLTSAITGAILRKHVPQADILIWDKAKGAGGRMSTSRCIQNQLATLDLGAQYISATSVYKKLHQNYYEELGKTGIIKPLTAKVCGMKNIAEGTENYIMPSGSSSLVKHFLNKIGSEVKFNHHVSEVKSKGKQWEVCTQHGASAVFDVVVMTMPVPQVLALDGNIQKIIGSDMTILENLQTVAYSSRFALGLFYPNCSSLELGDQDCAKYITDDDIFRFVAIDNVKRNVESKNPSVVFHSSVSFGKENVDKTPSEVEGLLLAKVKQRFPHWPEPIGIKCHKWRYSQVTTPYPGMPGCVSITDGLIVGGDGFTHSNMDGCIESAKAIAEEVSKYVSDATS